MSSLVESSAMNVGMDGEFTNFAECCARKGIPSMLNDITFQVVCRVSQCYAPVFCGICANMSSTETSYNAPRSELRVLSIIWVAWVSSASAMSI